MTTLVTTRLTLSDLDSDDAGELFQVRGDPEVMVHWDWPPDTNVADTVSVVRELLCEVGSGRARYWTVRLRTDRSCVGVCDLSEIHENQSADLGFMLARRFWGLGLGREAIVCVLDQARLLNLKVVHARIHEANTRSARLLQSTAFKEVETLSSLEIRPGVRRTCRRFELCLAPVLFSSRNCR